MTDFTRRGLLGLIAGATAAPSAIKAAITTAEPTTLSPITPVRMPPSPLPPGFSVPPPYMIVRAAERIPAGSLVQYTGKHTSDGIPYVQLIITDEPCGFVLGNVSPNYYTVMTTKGQILVRANSPLPTPTARPK